MHILAILLVLASVVDSADSMVSGDRLDPIVIDTGYHLPMSNVQVQIHFLNRYSFDLVDIVSKANCSCAVTTPDKTRLAPGESANIEVAFQTGVQPGLEMVRVYVSATGDNHTLKQPFHVKAIVGDYLDAPTGVSVLDATDPASKIILTRGTYPDAWTSLTCSLDDRSTGMLALTFEKSGSNPDAWTCRIHPGNNDHRGIIKGSLVFHFAINDKPLEHVQVVDFSIRNPSAAVSVSPAHLLIGTTFPRMKRTAIIRLTPQPSFTGPPVTIIRVQPSDPVRVLATPEPEANNGESHVAVVFTADDRLGRASGELSIHLSNGEVLHVPYAAAVVKLPEEPRR